MNDIARQKPRIGRWFKSAGRSREARIALWWIGTRIWAELAMVAGTFFARKDNYWAGHVGNLAFRQVPSRLLDVWGRWDTDFYLSIASQGYPGPEPSGGWVYNAAYFPLYPCLIRGASVLLGGANLFYVGIAVANALLILAIVYFDKLLRIDHPPPLAALAVACLMAYPGSHFFSCVYPESTALFLGVFAVYCVRRGSALLPGLACALAAVTRSSGIFICLPVLIELCRDPEGRLRPTWRVLVLAFPMMTLLAYMGLHWQLYRDPIYFVHVQAGWGRHPSFFLAPLFRFDLSLDYHLFALLAIAGAIWGVRTRQRASHLALTWANVLLPLSTGMLRGLHRYMGSNFPLFDFLAQIVSGRPRWRRLYLGAGLLTLGLFSFKWGQGFQPN